MNKLFLLSSIAVVYVIAVCSAPTSAADVVNVCAYSKSPDDYAPNCYTCLKDVYAMSLMACLNNTELPKNITYKQADCLEKNCQIPFPTPDSASPVSSERLALQPILQWLGRILTRSKRDVDNNGIDSSEEIRAYPRGHVVRQVYTVVMPRILEFTDDPDYK